MVKRHPDGRWKKGETANPAGRPKGSINLTQRIREVLTTEGKNGKEVADMLAETLVREALKNPSKMWSFLKEFLDRDEGRTDGRDGNSNDMTSDQTAAAVRAAILAMQSSVPSEPDES